MPPCVLIVDDDADIREALAEILTDAGYEVRMASDGAEALTAMRACAPCVVVLDLMMPAVDGWQVIQAMRSDQSLASVPVCLVTACPPTSAPTDIAVLRKPIAIDTLMSTIERSCGPPC